MFSHVVLMGRLVSTPELKHTQSGTPFSSFTIAVQRNFSKELAERKTDFIDIIAWKNTASFVSKYFKKGQLISVRGHIQIETYTDKEGKKRKHAEVVAEQVSFCGSDRYIEYSQNGGEFEELESKDDLPWLDIG